MCRMAGVPKRGTETLAAAGTEAVAVEVVVVAADTEIVASFRLVAFLVAAFQAVGAAFLLASCLVGFVLDWLRPDFEQRTIQQEQETAAGVPWGDTGVLVAPGAGLAALEAAVGWDNLAAAAEVSIQVAVSVGWGSLAAAASFEAALVVAVVAALEKRSELQRILELEQHLLA